MLTVFCTNPIVNSDLFLLKADNGFIKIEDKNIIVEVNDKKYVYLSSDATWNYVNKFTDEYFYLGLNASPTAEFINAVIYDKSFYEIVKPSKFEDYHSDEECLELYKDNLRTRRVNECYSIVNRGKLWYNHLSFEQLSELTSWYRAWLNVTETLIVPEKLNWVNNKLEGEELL